MGNRKHTVDVDLVARKRVDRDEQGTKGRQYISEFAAVDFLSASDSVLIERQNGEYKKTTLSDIRQFADAVYNVLDYGAVGDGVTDDYSAIQDAIDACDTNGGGIAYIPAGTYLVGTVLLVGDNTQVIGGGMENTIIMADSSMTGLDSAYGVIGAKGKDYVRFADFTVDLQTNSSATNGIVLWPTVTTGDAMTGDPCTNCIIERCKVMPYNNGTANPTGYAIWSRRGQGIRILNNYIIGDTTVYDSDSQQEGIEIFGGEDVLVSGNYVESIGNYGIFINTHNDAVSVHNYRITISDNHVKNCSKGIGGDIHAYSVAQGNQISDGILISNNQIVDSYTTGISLRQATAPGSATDMVARNIIVKSNIVLTDNALAGATQNIGIEFDKQQADGEIFGCQIVGNSVAGGKSGTSKGLIYANRFNGGLIKDNIVSGDSQTGSESYYLAYVNASTNWQFTGNTLHEGYRAGMNIAGCSNYRVSGNSVYDTDIAAGDYALIGLATTHDFGLIENNMLNGRVAASTIIGSLDANQANRTNMMFKDNIVSDNSSLGVVRNVADSTQNFGEATIGTGVSSVTVSSNLIKPPSTSANGNEGSVVIVNQVSGTIGAFTVVITDGQFVIDRGSNPAVEAVFRYQIR